MLRSDTTHATGGQRAQRMDISQPATVPHAPAGLPCSDEFLLVSKDVGGGADTKAPGLNPLKAPQAADLVRVARQPAGSIFVFLKNACRAVWEKCRSVCQYVYRLAVSALTMLFRGLQVVVNAVKHAIDTILGRLEANVEEINQRAERAAREAHYWQQRQIRGNAALERSEQYSDESTNLHTQINRLLVKRSEIAAQLRNMSLRSDERDLLKAEMNEVDAKIQRARQASEELGARGVDESDIAFEDIGQNR